MLCKIADLLVEVPAVGGMAPRCEKYLCSAVGQADIVIHPEAYRHDVWPHLGIEGVSYMESGIQFYSELLKYDGLMLHASAVEYEGKAYLFSGPCGVGKSTHTRLWQTTFGPAARVFNDDKPALRRINGAWYAFGTPWCGKDGINHNIKVPVAGICFLKRGHENNIRSLCSLEAVQKVVSQTRRKFWEAEKMDQMLQNIEQLVRDIPIFELENRPEREAAQLSYETMLRAAQERNL